MMMIQRPADTELTARTTAMLEDRDVREKADACRDMVKARDFKLEIAWLPHPQAPHLGHVVARATCTHAGRPLELSLIVGGILSDVAAALTVLDGCMHTLAALGAKS